MKTLQVKIYLEHRKNKKIEGNFVALNTVCTFIKKNFLKSKYLIQGSGSEKVPHKIIKIWHECIAKVEAEIGEMKKNKIMEGKK